MGATSPSSTDDRWLRLQGLTAELVGQDDEAAILRVALADSASLLGCEHVEVWLAPSAYRPGLYAACEPGGTDAVEVRAVEGPLPPAGFRELAVPLVAGEVEIGSLRLLGCPGTGRAERRRLAIGFAHLLSISLAAAHTLGRERRVAQESMRRAHQDGLTLLGNRWLLKEWGDHLLALAAARARTSALLLFDIDGFKHINDTMGHDVGDQVLAEIGRRIRDSVRENDLAVRLGGDEFVVLTDDLLTPADAEPLADRLLRAIAQPVTVDGVELRIRSSAGIAVHEQDGASTDELLRAADQAMYLSKADGHGRWRRSTASCRGHGTGNERLLHDLTHGALWDQLEPHFQPQLELSTGRVAGFEALARWRHPDLGLIAAHEFIPVVERAGRTRRLTAVMLERALEAFGALLASAPEAHLGLNISPRDLLGNTLVPEVARALSAHQIPPDRLVIEVSEPSSAAVESDVLTGLAALGCAVSISEFGTGQSSLTALARHQAIREVKLDASLVGQLPEGPARRLVAAVTDAAHTLGVRVVAEGVENRRTADQVRELGCDLLQGSHVHPPAPTGEVVAWLRRRTLPSDA